MNMIKIYENYKNTYMKTMKYMEIMKIYENNFKYFTIFDHFFTYDLSNKNYVTYRTSSQARGQKLNQFKKGMMP